MPFRAAVKELIQTAQREVTHPLQGYIPAGMIDQKQWVAKEVRIPNPHGGTHPAADIPERHLSLYDVPLPHQTFGFIQAIFDSTFGINRAVTIGFKGGKLAFPYVINFLSPLKALDDAPMETTPNRKSVVTARLQTAGGSQTPATTTPALPAPPVGVSVTGVNGPDSPLGPPIPAAFLGSPSLTSSSPGASPALGPSPGSLALVPTPPLSVLPEPPPLAALFRQSFALPDPGKSSP